MRHDVGHSHYLWSGSAGSFLGRGSQGSISNSESNFRGREQNPQSKLSAPEAEALNVEEKFGSKEQERREGE